MAASMKLKNREICLRILAISRSVSTTVAFQDAHKTSKMMQNFFKKKQRSRFLPIQLLFNSAIRTKMVRPKSNCLLMTHQDQDSLLVKRQTDNHSPGPVAGEISP